MTKPQFKTWLRKAVAELNEAQNHEDYLEIRDLCGRALRQAGNQATTLGLADAVERCAKAKRTLTATRSALAFCLSALGKPQTKSAPSEGPFSIEQAAARLGLSKSKLYEDARRGLLPHKRVGRRVVVTLDQLQTYQATIEDKPPTVRTKFRHLS